MGSQAVSAVALALLVVLQATAPVAAVAASTPGQNGPPSGMVGVPNAAVSDKIPDHAQGKVPDASAFRGSVMTDAHADTLAVEVTTRAAAQGRASACSRNGGPNDPPFCDDPTLALNISDDVNHDGRRVAVPKDVLADALGYVPTTATVVHESGEESEVPVRERGSLFVIDVPHFSTNTVSFSGTVNLRGNEANDGTTYQYDVGDLDAASAPNLTLEGAIAAEWDNESGTTELGESASISPAGLGLDPAGPSANGKPTLTATAPESVHSESPFSSGDEVHDLFGAEYYGDLISSEVRIDNPPEYIDTVSFDPRDTGDSGTATISIYIVEGTPNQQFGEGTKVKDHIDVNMDDKGRKTWTFDPVEISDDADSITVEFVTHSAPDNERLSDNTDSSQGDYFYNNRNDGWGGGLQSFYVEYSDGFPSNVGADADDGASASLGDFGAGETKTVEFPVSRSASSLSFSGTGTPLDWTLRMQERSETRDPGVELNGEWTNHTGTLAPGETASYTLLEDSLQAGTNRLNVSLADGSADAPTPQVGLEYEHDARDDETVQYRGETWSERYNVSRTWSASTANASLTVPFAGNVVSNRDVRVFINGTETGATYSEFDGTELEVGLGDLDPQTKTRVEANGSKVVVRNGSIQVLGPTAEGDDLDTRFEVTSADDGFRIDVSGTASGDRVHYLHNATWTPASDYVRVENSGSDQYLHVPNASAGSTATARTLPLSVNPQNDVELAVADPTEPKFKLRPGRVSGDAVDLTYYDTNSGTEYQLLDEDNDKIADSDTAESPAYFSVDSDEETVYSIVVADSSESEGGGGGGGRDRDSVTDLGNEPLASPIVMIVVAAAVILVGAWVASRTGLSVRWVAAVGVFVALGTLETLRPGTVTGPVEGFLGGAEDVAPVLWLVAGGIALLTVYGLYSRYGKPPRIVFNRGGR